MPEAEDQAATVAAAASDTAETAAETVDQAAEVAAAAADEADTSAEEQRWQRIETTLSSLTESMRDQSARLGELTERLAASEPEPETASNELVVASSADQADDSPVPAADHENHAPAASGKRPRRRQLRLRRRSA